MANAASSLRSIRSIVPRTSRSTFDRLERLLAARSPDYENYLGFALARVAYTADLMARYLQPGQKVLDVASGAHFSMLMSAALPVVAWQPTDSAPGAATQFFEHDGTLAYRYEPLPISLHDGHVELPTADVITLFEVLEHLPWNPAELFASFNDALPNGGLLVVSTPNVGGLSPIWRQLVGSVPYQTPLLEPGEWYHRREYSVHDVEALMRWGGFEIVESCTADVYRSDLHGWSHWVYRFAFLMAGLMTTHWGAVRHALWRTGSTMFVVARKARAPARSQPKPEL